MVFFSGITPMTAEQRHAIIQFSPGHERKALYSTIIIIELWIWFDEIWWKKKLKMALNDMDLNKIKVTWNWRFQEDDQLVLNDNFLFEKKNQQHFRFRSKQTNWNDQHLLKGLA